MKNLLLATGALSLLAAAAFAQPPQPYGGQPRGGAPGANQYVPPPAEQDYGRGRGGGRGPRIEPLYGVEAARDRLRIRVPSNGCTQKADFQVQTTGQRNAPDLTFRRVRPDNCRSFAMGSAWIEFRYQELGIRANDSFTIGNPITAWTGPGR